MKDITYNFGAIRDSIARLSAIELMRENKSATLEKYISKTSLSPDLKKQQLIYKNIQECKPFVKERLAERFINQNLSMFKNSNWDNMIFENKQLRYELLGAPDVSHIVANDDEKLFEAINTLIESVSNKRFSKFEREAEAYEFIIEHLTREVSEKENSKEKDDSPSLKEVWKFVTKLAVSNFNERYEHLNESERDILSILLSNDKSKTEFLNEVKNKNIKLIDSLLEDSENINRNTLIDFKEKMEKMEKISPTIIDECILECVDLNQELNKIIL